VTDLVVRITGEPNGAIKAMADVSGAANDFAHSIVEKLAAVTAGVFSFEKAFEGLHAGILKADEIRDLTLSLGTLTGSFERGTEVMRLFEEQSARTRNTAEELGRVFRDILPLSSARGFSQESTSAVSTLLSQFSTIMGTDLSTSESGYQMLLAGRVTPGRNPLLKMLGFTKEDVDVTWSGFFDRLIEKTKDFDKFGQSFESSTHKIKDAWSVAFGEGFNDAMGNGRKAYSDLVTAFENPALIGAISSIGAAFGNLAIQIGNAANAWSGRGISGANANALTASMLSLGNFLVGLNNQNLLGHGSGTAELSDYSRDKLRQFGDVDNGMFPSWFRPQAAANTEQFGPYLDAAQRSRVDFEAGLDALQRQATVAGEIAIAMKKAADAEKELADIAQTTKDAFNTLTSIRGGYSSPLLPFYQQNDALFGLLNANNSLPGSQPEYGGPWPQELSGRGLITSGNIDLAHRPIVKNDDGSISTVRSISIDVDGQVILIPTVSDDGRIMTDQEAVKQFRTSGKHLGVFDSEDAAGKYAVSLHDQQAAFYGGAGSGGGSWNGYTLGGPWNGYTMRQPSSPWLSADDLAPTSESFAKQFSQHLRDSISGDEFQHSVSDMLISAAEGGGKRFGEVAASYLHHVFASELDVVMKDYLPTYNPQTKQYETGGNEMGNQTLGKWTARGVTGVESLGAGYSAGVSGQSGGRLTSDIEGAVAGFASGGPVGAIVGLIGAVIGGFLGANARQADYQYGIPNITGGIAGLGDTKNLTPGAITQITTQVQQEYDQIHSGLIDLILKFPNLAIPSFDDITGKFQDNPSAHWGEHLQQWISGTLPKEMIASLGEELAKGFESYGMSGDAFKKMFSFLQGIDPKQAITDLSQLADALKNLFGVLPGNTMSIDEFFHGNYAPDIFTGGRAGSATFQRGMGDIALQGTWSPGQRIYNQFAPDLLKDASALNAGGLSPIEEIRYLGEIANLKKQMYDAEKQAIENIYSTQKALNQTAEGLISQYTVQGMVGADGRPDYSRITSYYQGQGALDLRNIQNAKSSQDVDYWTRQFYNLIGQEEQAGIQGGGNVKDWSKWATDQVQKANDLAQKTLTNLGLSINTTNDILNKGLDPALQKFLQGVTDLSSAIGGGDRDLPGKFHEINNAITDTAPLLQQVNAGLAALLGTLSAAGFASRTAARRSAAA